MSGPIATRIVAVVVAVLLAVVGAPLSAAASDVPAHDPHATDRQRVQQLADRIEQLQRTSDRAGRAAQKADERYLDAKISAAGARAVMIDARAAASAAVTKATESRRRASAVAGTLARTDLGTLPLSLMLNHSTADRVLGGLSTAGQLSAQSHALYAQATADEEEARRLQAIGEQKSREAARKEQAASDAYTDAKQRARDAKRDVQDARAKAAALIARITEDDGSALGEICAAIDGTPDVCRAPSAPTGGAADTVGGRVVAFARAQIGDPYVFAAAGPDDWDCSGLTLGSWASVGVSIGIHSATAQYRKAREQDDLIPLKDAAPGDLLFYSDGGGDMYHITIYSGDGRMIEAPYPGADVREVPVRSGDLVPEAAHFD